MLRQWVGRAIGIKEWSRTDRAIYAVAEVMILGMAQLYLACTVGHILKITLLAFGWDDLLTTKVRVGAIVVAAAAFLAVDIIVILHRVVRNIRARPAASQKAWQAESTCLTSGI